MTASRAAKSMCRGAEMKEAPLQTEIIKAITAACLSADTLATAVGQPPSKVGRALSGLVLRGMAERREKGCFAATAFGLEHVAEHGFVARGAPKTKKSSRAAVRGTLRQRAWNVMRIQSPFTVRAIAALAAKDNPDAEHSLHKWFSALEVAGYLQREPRREAPQKPGSNGLLRYRLVKNTGMTAPVHSVEHGCIRDLNTGKDTPCLK